MQIIRNIFYLSLLIGLPLSIHATRLQQSLSGYEYEYNDNYQPISEDDGFQENFDDYGESQAGSSFYYDTAAEDVELSRNATCPNGRCPRSEVYKFPITKRNQDVPSYVDYYPSYYRRYPIYLGHRYGPFFGNTYQ